MTTQPEALRLAESLMDYYKCSDQDIDEAAAELRRLHQFSEDQIGRATAAEAALQMTKATHALKIAAVETQRDALLEALNSFMYEFGDKANSATVQKARAAIKAVEETK